MSYIVKICYWKKQLENSLVILVYLVNWYIKGALGNGRPRTEKGSKAAAKVEQGQRLGSHDISKKLNIDHQIE